jgi:hypothetical protein
MKTLRTAQECGQWGKMVVGVNKKQPTRIDGGILAEFGHLTNLHFVLMNLHDFSHTRQFLSDELAFA